MKLTIKTALSTLAIVLSAVTSASSQTGDSLPSADDVVAKMLQGDVERRSELTGYSALRRYVAVNKDRRAEMVVRVDCSPDGTKQFTVISEEGSSSIRKHVFYKMLSEENMASRREVRDGNRITPTNYKFNMVGQDTLDTGPAYVLAITPKAENKYLVDGRIWVNAKDYSIVRVEGQPARDPSFWVHNVHFVHTYQRVGQFWFASSTHSTSEVRIFGRSELTIENSDYALIPPKKRTAEAVSVASLVR
jgi:outer membrane lipoprotein-sorting protein